MEENERVWAPDPDGNGEVRATFLAIAVGEPIDVNGVERDAAWVSFDDGDRDGTTGRIPYYKLRQRSG